jgi:hypothetical protein
MAESKKWKQNVAESIKIIDRGVFTSVKCKSLRYIRLYQKTAKSFQWKYGDVRRRIPSWWRCLGDSPPSRRRRAFMEHRLILILQTERCSV